jgi:FlaA1/EpsC-like NDP-sugar epimerase
VARRAAQYWGVAAADFFLLLVGASRAMSRFWLVGFDRTHRKVNGRLQIYGVGTTGLQMAEALAVSGQFELLVFVVDDTGKVGRSINCVHVFPREVIAGLVSQQRATDISLALPPICSVIRMHF